MIQSKRLLRQLQRAFGSVDLDGLFSRLQTFLSTQPDEGCSTKPEESQLCRDSLSDFISHFPEFLSAVDASYLQDARLQRIAQNNLKISSSELNRANQTLFERNRPVNVILDNLDQGVFAFNSDGICLPAYSKACLSIFGVNPVNLRFEDVLRIPPSDSQIIRDWYQLIFNDRLDFDDWALLGPRKLHKVSEGEDSEIALKYRPVYSSSRRLVSVLVIASDRSIEVKAQKQAVELQSYASMVMKIARSRNDFALFLSETKRLLGALTVVIDKRAPVKEDASEIKRNLHMIKGAAATFCADKLRDRIHLLENHIAEHSDPELVQKALRAEIGNLHSDFEQIVSESTQIIGEDRRGSADEELRYLPATQLKEFARQLLAQSPDQTLASEFVNRFVAEPFVDLLRPCEETLRDVCRSLKKEIQPVVYQGTPPLVLRQRYGDFAFSLIQLFSNIADHGIETPAVRENLGKPTFGLVVVRFSISPSNRFLLEIEDDGQGIDTDLLAANESSSAQLTEPPDSMKQRDLDLASIFSEGVTTSRSVNQISGRGLGLSIVQKETARLGGTVRVTSVRGFYTRFIFDLPLYAPLTDLEEQN